MLNDYILIIIFIYQRLIKLKIICVNFYVHMRVQPIKNQ